MNKITSLEIKHAVMEYFRFKRQWICASECMDNDVMAITDKYNIEVEIKITKYDLWKGEARKSKHKQYASISTTRNYGFSSYVPNKFYICIPENLKEEAIKWVQEINPKYGIIEYKWGNVYIIKKAQILRKEFNKIFEKAIMMRVCSENIGLIGRLLREKNGL